MGRRASAGALAAAGLAVLAFPAVLLSPSVGLSPGESLDRATLAAMNPRLLGGGGVRRVVVEIDAVEGCEPSAEAVDALRRATREAVPPEVALELVPVSRVSARLWDEQAHGDPARLARYSLDHLPDAASGTWVVYGAVVPGAPRDVPDRLGERVVWRVEHKGEVFQVDGFVVYAGAMPREALMARVLVHEIGHVLGLVHVPSHEAADARGHCADPACVMSFPGWRARLAGLPRALVSGRSPLQFCPACRGDIDRARRLFAAGPGIH